ncbi:hypothetical protein ACNHKD_04290 [Methylocystis sp. JAN1]|uniref:hypothetical protein n=1 Tax=Methylocystis sp. JAN1 TaxID=3397211 RepID=UPI003FA2E886
MPTPCNLSAMMTAAHRAARKAMAAGKGAYRAVFAKALCREWRIAREDAARFAQNIGRPVGSCLADLPSPAPVCAPIPAARPAFRQFGSARVFFGANAREAAIADAANRVASSFTRARAAGRRVANFV